MATVNITDKLLSGITTKINHMSAREVAAEYPKINESVTLDASELFNRLEWGQHLHLMPQLPSNWMKQHNDVTITVNKDGRDAIVTRIEFKGCRTARSLPHKTGWNANYTNVKESEVDLLPATLVGAAELRQRLSDQRGVDALNVKWKKIKDEVDAFFRGCSTLNQALKAVPAMRLYVPKDYLDRVDAKVERSAKTTVEVKFDVDQLTAAAIGAQLAGS